ncbi:MAG: hypothetical protein ABI856_18830, partial [Nitrospira sp.]
EDLGLVEAFIRDNHRLPDLPSATDVAERGIDLGRMQSTLLAKIEELTLYVIEQKKDLEALRGKVTQLEQENAPLTPTTAGSPFSPRDGKGSYDEHPPHSYDHGARLCHCGIHGNIREKQRASITTQRGPGAGRRENVWPAAERRHGGRVLGKGRIQCHNLHR